MCEPTSIILGTAIAANAGSQILGHKGAQEEARAAQQSALDALTISLQDIRARGLEETLAAAEAVRDTRRQARAVAASAGVSAAEEGVGGVSVDLLLGDIERQGGERVVSIETNRDARLRQLEREARGVRAQALSRIRGAPEPSFLQTGLNIVGGTVGALSGIRGSREQTKAQLTGGRAGS